MTPQTAVTHVFGGTSTSAVAVCDRGLSLLKTVSFFPLTSRLSNIENSFWSTRASINHFCFVSCETKKMGKCSFQAKWLEEQKYQAWLAGDSDKHRARCKLCRTTFSVAAMLTGKNIVRCVPAPAHQLA
eukprot:scpid82827/ scgid27052/ 